MKKFIYFSAPWCGPCKTLSPIMDQVAQDGISLQKVNVDNEPEISQQYNIRNIPTVVLVNASGTEVTRTVGVQSKQAYIDMYNQN
jgi:thioredoxin 1